MHQIDVASKLVYDVQSPSVLLLNVSVANTSRQQIVSERLDISPSIQASPLAVGLEDNRFHRLMVEPCQLVISYTASVSLSPATEDAPDVDEIDYAALPPDVLPYLSPSRYCESDRLVHFAQSTFGTLPRNFERVHTICDWMCANLSYQAGTTTALTTACDVMLQRCGVCRDFAHVAIAMCRALGVPARYVSGYACRLQPPDFHGFFEAYLGGRWYLFDPTRLAPPAGLVRIGAGRDAADTAFATIWGDMQLQEMSVSALQTGGDNLLDTPPGDVAISTA